MTTTATLNDTAVVVAAPVHPATVRAAWIDAERGLIISLVVLGHVVNGMLTADLLPRTTFWSDLYAQMHTFRMPTFFLVCGLLVRHRLAKGSAPFLRDIGTRIAWPYMLWGSVQLVVISLAGRHVNQPIELDWTRFASLPWVPPSQFWFLQALAGFHLLAVAGERKGRMGGLYLATALVLLAKLAVDQGVWPGIDPAGLLAGDYPYYLAFYSLGVALGPDLRLPRLSQRTLLLVTLCAGAAWFLLLGPALVRRDLALSVEDTACSIAGVVACVALAHLPAVSGNRLLRHIGRHSLSVLALHVFFIAGTRIVLSQFLGWREPALLLPLALLAGLAGPLLVVHLTHRFGVSRWVGLS